MKYSLIIILMMFISACANKRSPKIVEKNNDTKQQVSNQADQSSEKIESKKNTEIKKTETTLKQEKIKVNLEQKNISKDQPLAVIARYTKKLRTYVDQPNSKNRESSIAQEVREFFDFQELAKRSLGRNWTKQSASNRRQYSDLFIQLVESSYLKRSRQIIGGYEVTFKDQKIKKNDTASVTSTVSQEDANIDIRYDLLQKNKQWMIYNITLDDVNLVRTYQSQFNKIIKDKGFSYLISLMKKRVKAQSKDDITL